MPQSPNVVKSDLGIVPVVSWIASSYLKGLYLGRCTMYIKRFITTDTGCLLMKVQNYLLISQARKHPVS